MIDVFMGSICCSSRTNLFVQVRTVEGEAASFLDQISRYFVSRARLVTKVAKYPHVVCLFVFFYFYVFLS